MKKPTTKIEVGRGALSYVILLDIWQKKVVGGDTNNSVF